ncbi:PAS domain-containing sensor histidine kinase [Pedobacter duraquae]|uniref:histidine kinase n=1 Tax=Pedobacter duraquae TaxID=425511 RepID=A0A4R6IHP6_9SPHI|nr:PAS domain-containing sensor histidine kinase [Pedobacter duraquae]TDO20795.1 PAS domain S-box-containing protein [Pedobacter duraquae]
MSEASDKPLPNKDNAAGSEDRFQALINASSDVVYSLSADWSVMRELDGRGFLKDALEPTTDWQTDNIFPDDLEKVRKAIADAIREKKIFQLEHRVLRADRTPGWTFSRAVPILDKQGNIIEWFGTASDITEHKNAEEALRMARVFSDQQKRVYETITSATPDLMYVFDLDYRFTYANGALLSMWGKTWETAVGKSLLENGYEPWHAEMHEREIDLIVKTKQPVRGEVSFPHAILGRRVYDYILTPVLNDEGEVEAVAGTTRDVTDRKQWEESLARSSEKLQAINEEMAATNEEQAASNEELTSTNEELALVNQKLIEAQAKIEESQIALRLAISAANFGTWYIHSATREFITDSRLKELFGYFPHEALSIEQALAQITDDYRGYVSTKLENAIYNNGDYDVTYPVIGLHDNKLRWLRAIGNLKADPSGAFSAFTGVVMEITEQFLAAKQVEQAEESLRMAIDAAGLGTFFINAADRIFVASPKLKEFFGFLPDEEVPYDAAINQIHPDYRKRAADMVEAAFTEGKQFDMEYPVIGFHDGTIRWVRGMGTMQHYDGKDYFTGVLHEITERKQDEMRKNDFIGMVSHELKTPLTSLKAIVQVANAKLKNNGDQFLAEAMTKADAQIKRMTAMINGFLDISRLESGKIIIVKKVFDVEELAREIIEEMKLSVQSHDIRLVESGKLVEVYADRDKVNSVISNLISNAVKYSAPLTTIRIACTINQYEVLVSVRDEGIGIAPQDVRKIFDRYYRVENGNTGTISGFGIGLYLSAEIVQHHGGKIWVDSEQGKGSTFYFSLPAGR